MESGKLLIDNVEFNLMNLVEDIADAMAVKAVEKHLEIICVVEPEVPAHISGDPGRLRQIIVNLLGNSIKFTNQGEVILRISLEEDEEECVYLKFSVVDTGIGIDESKQNLLFQSFTQVDGSISREYGGTGLGLAICRQLAVLMGGDIGVYSKPNKGSEFWFTARFEKTSLTQVFQKTELLPGTSPTVNILVVDDNQTNMHFICSILAQRNTVVRGVSSGKEALDEMDKAFISGSLYKMVIMDKYMPEMDGETLGRTIRLDKRFDDVYLIMMTTFGQRGDVERLKDIGFSAYLTKPVKKNDLLDTISFVLGMDRRLEQQPMITRHVIRDVRRDNSRILVVEDDLINQHVAVGFIKKLGYGVDVASNGFEAIRMLTENTYSLVLMDIQMPGMSGLEATRRIRSGEAGVQDKSTIIVAMTANAMRGDRERCTESGMDDYIAKPMTLVGLSEMMEKWISSKSPADIEKKQTSKDTLNTGPSIKEITSDNTSSAEDLLVFNAEDMMNRLAGNKDLAQVVIDAFLEDIPRQIVVLRELIESGDVQGAERQSHRIKGAASNVGGDVMHTVAAEMEKMGRNGQLADMSLRYYQLEDEFDRLKCILEKGILK
jgi:CheY-like chemotaxis protein/HPt (histidine-containing phosphotransfer) domain-containing protein